MTHEELITMAREHSEMFIDHDSIGVSADVFTEARVVEAAVVYLGSKTRDDYIEVIVDRESGDFITATYNPGPSKGQILP